MKRILIFAGFMGILLTGSAMAANGIADDANASNYPSFSPENIKVATTNYVDTKVGTEDTNVANLASRAQGDTTQVTTNGTDITAMQTNRQVIPTNNCEGVGSGQNALYSGCGYISGNGTTGSYNWIKIRSGNLVE